MLIFPIGTISAASSKGSIDSVSYSYFAPNSGVFSNKQHNILSTLFESKIMQTRKKNEPYLTLVYRYDDIYSREYRQIEHFIDSIDESSTSFFAPDLGRGQTPSSITNSGGDWVVALDNTRLYSATTNLKANRAFIWDGVSWKEGDITDVTANTSITVNVDGSNFGDLSLARAQTDGIIYPLYEVYVSSNALGNFKETNYIREDITTTKDGGFMYSGELSMVSKYKV